MRINSNPISGLTSDEVKGQFEYGLDNKKVEFKSITVKEIIKNNVFTYFNLVFCILALFIISVGSFNDLAFMPVVIINIIIGIVQQIRSKKTLDKLSVISSPKTTVVRDGEEKVIENHLLVLDDIVVFSAGNQICADATVVSGKVMVNEALVTGESNEIEKKEGDFLLSGSFIVSGSCRARLESVGENSYASRISVEAKKQKRDNKSEMMKSLDVLVKTIGIIIIPVGILLFVNQHYILSYPFKESVVSTVGALIGMIPEGLYLLTSMALVISVMRLALKNTLVHDMGCIESLARVDVLCVDKTGTITEEKINVEDTILADDKYFIDDIKEKIAQFAFNMENDNATIDAVKSYYICKNKIKAKKVYSFSSKTKYSAVEFEDENYVLGAPDVLLNGENKTVLSYTKKGYRVLLFAKYKSEIKKEGITPLAFIVMINKIRDSASETFEYFKKQGVKIKVISGDNPIAVSEIAKKTGIENAENYIDARMITDEKMLFEAAEKYTVFGRVTPTQKKQLVIALKDKGHTVAMTGDGVNDVLALKEADCSVALLSGSEVACHASKLVLLDSDFSSMPHVVYEGRRVINNIERAASLFLIKNVFSFLFAIISILAFLKYPVKPSQLTLVSTTTIGIPSFFLALEPNKDMVKGHFIKNVLFKALPAGITNVILILCMYISNIFLKIPSGEFSTMATIVMGTVGLTVLFRISKPFNARGFIIWFGMLMLFTLGATVFKWIFTLDSLSYKSIGTLLILMTLILPTMYILEYVVKKIQTRRS